jgi:hypothetical protein
MNSKSAPSGAASAYAAAYKAFNFKNAARALAGDLVTDVNVCVECCDRWAEKGGIALRWRDAEGRATNMTFAQLRDASARFANLLKKLGIGPGDRVAGMLPRTPDLLIVILGTWRAGAVYQPLFTAFGPGRSSMMCRMRRRSPSLRRLLVRSRCGRATSISPPNWRRSRPTSRLSRARATISSC